MPWYLIRNHQNKPCKCGKVHEYWSHDCRPVAFDHPEQWSIFRVEEIVDKGITLKTTDQKVIVSSLGPVVEIPESELVGLNIIRNPPSKIVAVSYPNMPVRRAFGGKKKNPGKNIVGIPILRRQ